MEGLHEYEKKIFNRWEELTSAETARREGVKVEWDGSLGAFDNATEMTVDSGIRTKKKVDSPERRKAPAKGTAPDEDILGVAEVSVEKRNNNNASTTSTKSPDIHPKSPNERMELIENAQGVLPDVNCTFCNKVKSHHYCRLERKGSNKFLKNKEICGNVMCHLCIFGWPGQQETYRGECKVCKEVKAKEEKEKDKKATKEKEKNTKAKQGTKTTTCTSTSQKKSVSNSNTGRKPTTKRGGSSTNTRLKRKKTLGLSSGAYGNRGTRSNRKK